MVIKWTGEDGLSGIDPATQPANSTITGEGSSLGTDPVSISDKAGNSASATFGGIKIDRTAPTITARAKTADGKDYVAGSWANQAVTVSFECSDALSGIPANTCPTPVTVTGNGADQQVSRTVSDLAGNSASATFGGIKIDGAAPESAANNQCDSKNGWCKGQTATVILTALDQANLSGVKEIRYSVNGNPQQSATGARVEVTVPLAAKSGTATVKFYAVDNAGNHEAENGIALKYDNIAPTLASTRNPEANGAGWNSSATTVEFKATDDDGGSGVDASTVKCTNGTTGAQAADGSVTCATTVGAETPATGVTLNAEAYDLAGNKGTDSPVTVKLDKTAPTITARAKTADGKDYVAGSWTNQAVTVSFECSDALSGIATCPASVTLTADGVGQEVAGTAEDKAGNKQSAKVSGINIDSVKPTITLNGIANGGVYILGAVPQASCTAEDSGGAGLAGTCSLTVTGGTANGVGTFNYTATAADNAGNTTTLTGSYTVVYNIQYGVAFFLQPINDTAHTASTTTSIFKAGSTVPVKFQLKDANGAIIQANSAPLWLTPAKGSSTTATVDENLYSDPATTGSTYRWDSTSQQYVYNWGTAKTQANYYWRIGVKLDDGRAYAVNIGLR